MDSRDSGARGSIPLTLLFTDIEASTSLWVDHADEANAAVALHDEILTAAITEQDGSVVKTTGDGFLATFPTARAGAEAAVSAQLALARRVDELMNAAHVRMGLHAGSVQERHGDLFGLTVNKCQRIMAAANAGQILVSSAAAGLLRTDLPPESDLIDLGDNRLKGIPDPERLYQLAHRGLRRDFPPLATVVGVPSNLPVELTSFIGREREVAEVLALTAERRLVTLTGSGGAGKTRLAIRVGLSARERFADGVWLVELDSLRDAGLVVERIASTLGLEERAGRTYIDLITHHLEGRRVLLIVDNCEHLIDACARAISTLLRGVADLRVLATSRQRLGVSSEVEYRVPPMSTPDENSDTASMSEHDSVRLLVDRARLARPSFELSHDNAEAVGRITRQLDGIPLALELAAAKLAVLTPEQIAEHLDDRFRLLTAGTRTALPRHQTLEAAVDWSYDLLPERERWLLNRLAVFRGGFDLAALEQVCADAEEGSVVTMLSALVEKSLVIADLDVARFRLLETVRQFAADRLDQSGDGTNAAARHADYFVAFAERAGPGLDGPSQATWLAALELERDNLRAAMEWSLGHEPMTLRLVSAMWRFWQLRRRPSEGRDWLKRALAQAAGRRDGWRVQALLGAGSLAAAQGEQVAAQELLADARELAEEIGDHSAAAASLTTMAIIRHKEGDLTAATRMFRSALDLARATSDLRQTSRILTNLSLVLEDQGHRDEAARCAEEALTVGYTTGVPELIADAMFTAGEIALNQGDRAAAQHYLEEAFRQATEAGLDYIKAWALGYLGRLRLQSDETKAAQAFLGEAVEAFRRVESPVGIEWGLRHLAAAELRAEEIESARTAAAEALRLAAEYVKPDVPYVLQVVGEIAAAEPNHEWAAVLLAAAQFHRDEMELRPPPYEVAVLDAVWTVLDSALEPDTLAAAKARGRSMTLNRTVEFALSWLETAAWDA
ncbi:MAG TPA: tetratricopeptide repeat protein [Acidimicrobiia bacterium]|nr:tetratricopeptide repeat protein [Acidimicrobiia bacterium]